MLPLAFGDGSSPLRILCLGAHSDDIEIGAGGTVLRLLAERPGSTVHWVVLSATPERAEEARASAADFLANAAEVDIRVADFRENYFPYDAAEIKAYVSGLGREVDPDVVFAHRRLDRHQDHRTVGELVWNTWRDHTVLQYEIPKYEGDLGRPNLYVPLGDDHVERKLELLGTHFASQGSKPWFRPEVFRGLMAIRAVECNAPSGHAEAFHAEKVTV